MLLNENYLKFNDLLLLPPSQCDITKHVIGTVKSSALIVRLN